MEVRLLMYPTHCQKLGLALSGGGFRAALFHLGVLAQMADLGLLRHVEVISTVSGGSIVGALYYLHLKALIESVPDAEIEDEHYRSIISRMETEFLSGVQKNLRMRTFSNIRKNWRMRLPNYSRSDRMGELYDTHFYHPAIDGTNGEMVRMRHLKIIPYGAQERFHPRRDNENRAAKVPILLLNSTSLNTGRNWRFEASRMGEPPRTDRVAYDVDKVTRLLRPPTYADLPRHLANMPLGLAVAASTAVPGLFVPLSISRLYPERRVELVDGGIHDNQGIQGLMDEGCQRFIVSDASGQMDEEQNPSTSLAGVLSRINSVLMLRIREEQLYGIKTGSRANSVSLVHLRKGLAPEVIPWQGATTEAAAQSRARATDLHIDEDVQDLLSHVRTDLDSFTEIEAFSLMQLGYTLSHQEFRRTPRVMELCGTPVRTDWKFRIIQPWMEQPTPQFIEHLKVASGRLFKVFRLHRSLQSLLFAMLFLAIGMLLTAGKNWLILPHHIYLRWSWWQVLLIGGIGLVAVVSRSAPLRYALRWARRPMAWAYRLIFRSLLPIGIALFIKLYLVTLDRLFLNQGRVSRLQPPRTPRKPHSRKPSRARPPRGA